MKLHVKEKIKLFLSNVKKQFLYNKQARTILLAYTKSGFITEEQNKILKNIIADNLKIVSLSSTFILPGGSLILPLLFRLAKKYNINIMPSQFNNIQKDEEIKN